MLDVAPVFAVNSKLNGLQVLRGLAALAVVYVHVEIISARFLGIDFNGVLASRGGLGVNLFFVLSGFIIVFVHWRDVKSRSGVVQFLLKRINRIYPLLWILLTLKLVFLYFVPGLSVDRYSLASVTKSYLLMYDDSYVMDAQWTLVFEMFFYFSFALALLFGPVFVKILVVLWSSYLFLIEIGFDLPFGGGNGVIFSPILLQFFVGGVVAGIAREFSLRMGVVIAALMLGVAAGLFAIVYDFRENYIWSLIFGLIVYGVVGVDVLWRVKWPRCLVFVGDASYSIYLVHSSVQMLIVLLGKRQGLSFDFGGQILLYVTGFLSVVAGMVCYIAVERPLLRCGQGFLLKFTQRPRAQ